jgi:hypothetical protein
MEPPTLLQKLRAQNSAHPSDFGVGVPPEPELAPLENAFKVEGLEGGFVRITIVCERPPARNALPDQESRGAMAMPRAVWFMTSIVKGFALQLKKPVIARAMDTVTEAARKEVERVERAKRAYDEANNADV